MAGPLKLAPNKAYPSIPTVAGTVENHTLVLEAVREALEIHERRSGDAGDSFVRLSELEATGVINIDQTTNIVVAPDDDGAYIRRDGLSPAATGEIDFGAGIWMRPDTAIKWGNTEYLLFQSGLTTGVSGPGGVAIPTSHIMAYVDFEDGVGGNPGTGSDAYVNGTDGSGQGGTYTGSLTDTDTPYGTYCAISTQGNFADTSIRIDEAVVGDSNVETAVAAGIPYHVEFRWKPSELAGGNWILQTMDNFSQRNLAIIYSNGTLSAKIGTTTSAITGSISPNTSTWYHVAITLDASGVFRLWFDGALVGSPYDASSQGWDTNGDPTSWDFMGFHEGRVDNILILRGTALYGAAEQTSGFTPPTIITPASLDDTFIVGDPASVTHIDGSLVELEHSVGINWDDGAGTNVELLVFDTATVTVNGVPPTAISARLSFTQSVPGFMATYNEVVDESGYGHAITYGSTVEADDGTLVAITPRADGDFFFAARAKAASWVELAPSPAFDFGTGDFCIEIWAYRPTSGNPNLNSGLMATGNLGWRVWWMSHSQGGDLRLQLNDVDVLSVEVAPWTADGEWNHIAFVRSGTTITLYYNGVARGSTTSSADFTSAGGGMIVGEGTYSKGFVSYAPLDDFRLTKGYPRYTQDFTPPSVGYTEDQETQFIVGDPNYITHIDGSLIELENGIGINWDDGTGVNVEHLVFKGDTFGFTVEPDPNLGSVTFLASFENATTGAEAFTPEIGPAFEWNLVAGLQPSQVDGEVSNAQAKFGTKSLYAKDTSGSPSAGWQTVLPLSGTRSDKYSFAGDFTIEFHIYVVAETNNVEALNIWDFGDQQWTFHLNGGRINFQVSTTGGNLVGIFATEGISPGNTAMANNTWYHVAVSRQGDTHYCFIDGVLTAGGVSGVNTVVYDMYEAAAPYLVIFQEGKDDGMGDVEAYIDNIRITDGVARYTTGFTPPAAPYDGSGLNTLFVGDPGYPTRIDGNKTTVTGDLTVNGATQLDSTLNVTGATTLASTLDVTGLATFNGGILGNSPVADTTTPILTLATDALNQDRRFISFLEDGGPEGFYLQADYSATSPGNWLEFGTTYSVTAGTQIFAIKEDGAFRFDDGLIQYTPGASDKGTLTHLGVTTFQIGNISTADDITRLDVMCASTADSMVGLFEQSNAFGVSLLYDGITNAGYLRGHDGTTAGVDILEFPRTSDLLNVFGGEFVLSSQTTEPTFQHFNVAATANLAQTFSAGIDYDWTFTGVTDWNITGITSIQAGTVDADFDAITATSYGGIVEANLLDLAAAETVTGNWVFSGTLTIPQAAVTAHEAALTILESQITDGAILARVAGTETITGAWTFSDELLALSFGEDSSSPASATNAITFDLANGAAFEVTLTENITSITISNPPTTGYHAVMTVKFIQDATGSWTVSGWPAAVKWVGGAAPTITGTATTGTDIVRLETWDAGTTWYGTYDQNFS